MSAVSREGVSFSAVHEGQMKNILFENVTIQNFTRSGVSIRGASNVTISHCDFSDNGSSVVPGAGFHHNLLLTRSVYCIIRESRFDTSPWGNGIDISFCRDVLISKNEAARNKRSGIRCTESKHVKAIENFVEGNDSHGILFDALMDGSNEIIIQNNFSGNNKQRGIYTGKGVGKKISNNKISENGLE
jgi:nitrous oxidase accessory protein NosD